MMTSENTTNGDFMSDDYESPVVTKRDHGWDLQFCYRKTLRDNITIVGINEVSEDAAVEIRMRIPTRGPNLSSEAPIDTKKSFDNHVLRAVELFRESLLNDIQVCEEMSRILNEKAKARMAQSTDTPSAN